MKVTKDGETYYVYDPSSNLIAELDINTGKWTDYVYGPAGRIATMTDTDTYWHHNDHLGTPQFMTDIYANVVWSMSQTPFGIATVNEDPDGDGQLVTNNFRFPGQYYDTETGLNYNYFRTYDPSTGRYTQSDPIGLNGGMNPFGYVGGNPINYIDPDGLKVRIIISRSQRDSNSQIGHISVASDKHGKSFFGYTLEPIRTKGLVPTGTYDAKLRKDHDPWRVELIGVLNNEYIQIHNGSKPKDSKGCFLVGSNYRANFVNNSINSMKKIISIITEDFKLDCSEKITVVVM